MSCDKYNDLMMRCMDKTITPTETILLNRHLSSCSACKEDFSVYEEIMAEFSAMEIISAPEGFEESVMLKIAEESLYKPAVHMEEHLEHLECREPELEPEFKLEMDSELSKLIEVHGEKNNPLESVLCFTWAFISVSLGLSILAMYYKDVVLSSFANSPKLYQFATSAFFYAEQFTSNISYFFESTFGTAIDYVASARLWLLGIICVLALLQVIIYNREARGIKS